MLQADKLVAFFMRRNVGGMLGMTVMSVVMASPVTKFSDGWSSVK